MKKIVTIVVFLISMVSTLICQNSIVGDGFGGRSWYKPCNISAGSYTAFTTCDGELYGWGTNPETIKLIGYSADGYYKPKPVYGLKNIKYHAGGYFMTAINYNDSAFVWETFDQTKPTPVMANVKYSDGGFYSGAIVAKSGKAYIVSSKSFFNVMDYIQYSSRDTVGDFMIQDVPIGQPIVRCAVGIYSYYFLTNAGDVYVINYNKDTPALAKPVLIKQLKNIVDIKTTSYGSLALDSGGRVYIWNKNPFNPVRKFSDCVAISGRCDGYVALVLAENGYCYSIDFPAKNKIIEVADSIVDIMAGETYFYLLNDKNKFSYHQTRETRSIKDNVGSLLIGEDFSLPEHCVNSPIGSFICKGDSLKVGNAILKQSGFHSVMIGNELKIVKLTAWDTLTTRKSIYHCFQDDNGPNRFDTFRYQLTDSTCVSVIEKIIVRPENSWGDTLVSCGGFVLDHLGDLVLNDTSYSHIYKSFSGCDSTIHTVVKIFKPQDSQIQRKICRRDSVIVANQVYKNLGLYYDTIRNQMGCDSIRYKIQILDTLCRPTVYIPDAFTPNDFGPSANNLFKPSLEKVTDFSMVIYNRWGEKIFQTTETALGWDGDFQGKPSPDGVYIYVIKAKFYDGETYELKGTFILIR